MATEHDVDDDATSHRPTDHPDDGASADDRRADDGADHSSSDDDVDDRSTDDDDRSACDDGPADNGRSDDGATWPDVDHDRDDDHHHGASADDRRSDDDHHRVRPAGRVMMRRTERTNERGAVLVETAIGLPVFFMVIFAIIEFGFVFRDYTSINAATSDAVRVLSIAGDDLDADHRTLEAFAVAAVALPDDSIDTIIVYAAAGPSDAVPTACLSGSVSGVCNVYTATDHLRDVTDFGCVGTSAPDRFYCPTSRDTAQISADFVGLHVIGQRDLITGFFGDVRTLTATEVLPVEPRDR